MLEFLTDLDTRIFLFLNGFHSEGFDGVMVLFSGRLTWVPLYLVLLIWVILRFRKAGLVLIPAAIVLIILSDQGSVHLFKNLVCRLRPCHEPSLEGMVHLVDGHCGGRFGFVSSHAANTAALATYTSLVFRNRYYGWFIFIWTAAVSYSRIYLGVHYPGDVIAGFVFGMLLGWCMYRLAGIILEITVNRKKEPG
jgi:undecaprenyl-diphosphatase